MHPLQPDLDKATLLGCAVRLCRAAFDQIPGFGSVGLTVASTDSRLHCALGDQLPRQRWSGRGAYGLNYQKYNLGARTHFTWSV